MEVVGRCCWAAALMVLITSSFLLPGGEGADTSAASLNSVLRDYAVGALVGGRTGFIYDVPLPSDLSGIRVSAMRLRSSILWSRGANVSSFAIRPGTTTTVPFARRIVLVGQNLGNRSASYYNVPGYSLAAPVVGLLAYDASNGSYAGAGELKFAVAKGGAIAVNFLAVEIPEPLRGKAKCASFGLDGSARLSETTPGGGACSTESAGHFAIVVPSEPAVPPPAGDESRWKVVVVAVSCACGVVGIAAVGLVGFGIVRLMRSKKIEEMERRSEQEEGLGNRWVGRSKMPSASTIRTQPAIEDGLVPPPSMNGDVHNAL